MLMTLQARNLMTMQMGSIPGFISLNIFIIYFPLMFSHQHAVLFPYFLFFHLLLQLSNVLLLFTLSLFLFSLGYLLLTSYLHLNLLAILFILHFCYLLLNALFLDLLGKATDGHLLGL